MADYQVTALEEIEEQFDGRCSFRPVRHHFGISTFGATTWTGRSAGDRIINEHDEKDEYDELYLVMSGSARFELAGDSVEAPTGTFVSVPAGVLRTAFANEAGTTILALGGGRAGEPFRAPGWDVWSPLRPLFDAGRYEEVIERAAPMMDHEPPYPELLYNVACAEALTGRDDDALKHLLAAIDDTPSLARYAVADEDSAAVRQMPGFIARFGV